MVVIFSQQRSARLNYICDFIFKEQLGVAYAISNDIEWCRQQKDFVINYSNLPLDFAGYKLIPHPLLFEKGITQQNIDCFEINNQPAFFKSIHSDLPFDIFAASFFLLSRYEEYLPHQKDMYGRFSHEESIAYKNGFLDIPLINYWLKKFEASLKEKGNTLLFNSPSFAFLPTYDIDMAWSYRYKGLLRNIFGFISKPSWERLKVLLHLQKDPFDSYEYLDTLHQQYLLQPVYFFLVATAVSRYDKNIAPYRKSMRNLIAKHASKYILGIHPSWKSNRQISMLKKEKKRLEKHTQKTITHSRQHYIKFNLPDTFEKLQKAGIEKEYSMGYGSINGFRASVASSFYWYNLQREMPTHLRIYPFCFMDANSFYEQHQNATAALVELEHYYNECKKTNGLLITIFHNNFFGTAQQFKGWKEMYSQFIAQLHQ